MPSSTGYRARKREHAPWCRRIEFRDGWWHTASCEDPVMNANYARAEGLRVAARTNGVSFHDDLVSPAKRARAYGNAMGELLDVG